MRTATFRESAYLYNLPIFRLPFVGSNINIGYITHARSVFSHTEREREREREREKKREREREVKEYIYVCSSKNIFFELFLFIMK